MTDFKKDRFDQLFRKSAMALGCVMMVLGPISGIHVNQGYSQSFPRSDGSLILQVQDQQANPLRKHNSPPEDQRTASDNIVKSQILALKLKFMVDPRLFPYEIDGRIQEKMIELTGVVALEEEKSLASHLTALLFKEKEIINHIEVRPSLLAALQNTTDARLTQLVTQRFAGSQTLREANFQVMTIRGVVSLSGQTRFQVIVLEAAQAAREIPGVIAVNTQNVRLEAEND